MGIIQGDIYWMKLDEPVDDPDYAHPYVVVQDDLLNHSRITTTVVCALSTNLKMAALPGNVLLEPGEANLEKTSVVVVSKISSVEKKQLGQYIGSLGGVRVQQILAGIRFLQASTRQPAENSKNSLP